MRSARAVLSRVLRATALVLRDRRIPRPLRWAGSLGLAPIPGPFDELILLVVAVPLLVFYRERLLAAWRTTAASRPA